jgi:hypothetical protein
MNLPRLFRSCRYWLLALVIVMTGCSRKTHRSYGRDVSSPDGSRSYRVFASYKEGRNHQAVLIIDSLDSPKALAWEAGADGTFKIMNQDVKWVDGVSVYIEDDGSIFRFHSNNPTLLNKVIKERIGFGEIEEIRKTVSIPTSARSSE